MHKIGFIIASSVILGSSTANAATLQDYQAFCQGWNKTFTKVIECMKNGYPAPAQGTKNFEYYAYFFNSVNPIYQSAYAGKITDKYAFSRLPIIYKAILNDIELTKRQEKQAQQQAMQQQQQQSADIMGNVLINLLSGMAAGYAKPDGYYNQQNITINGEQHSCRSMGTSTWCD